MTDCVSVKIFHGFLTSFLCKAYTSYPMDAKLGCATYFGQWHVVEEI